MFRCLLLLVFTELHCFVDVDLLSFFSRVFCFIMASSSILVHSVWSSLSASSSSVLVTVNVHACLIVVIIVSYSDMLSTVFSIACVNQRTVNIATFVFIHISNTVQ